MVIGLLFRINLISVPYVAMGYEMSDEFHERTNIMAIAQWIGQWAWVIAPLFWIIMYDPDSVSSADEAKWSVGHLSRSCTLCAMVPALFIKSNSTLDENYEPISLSRIGRNLSQILVSFGVPLKF